jgi:hypothetical protein
MSKLMLRRSTASRASAATSASDRVTRSLHHRRTNFRPHYVGDRRRTSPTRPTRPALGIFARHLQANAGVRRVRWIRRAITILRCRVSITRSWLGSTTPVGSTTVNSAPPGVPLLARSSIGLARCSTSGRAPASGRDCSPIGLGLRFAPSSRQRRCEHRPARAGARTSRLSVARLSTCRSWTGRWVRRGCQRYGITLISPAERRRSYGGLSSWVRSCAYAVHFPMLGHTTGLRIAPTPPAALAR